MRCIHLAVRLWHLLHWLRCDRLLPGFGCAAGCRIPSTLEPTLNRRFEIWPSTPRSMRGNSSFDGPKLLIAIAAMLGSMLFVWFYGGASGQRMGFGDFVLCFLREFLLLALLFIAGIVICLAWLWHHLVGSQDEKRVDSKRDQDHAK